MAAAYLGDWFTVLCVCLPFDDSYSSETPCYDVAVRQAGFAMCLNSFRQTLLTYRQGCSWEFKFSPVTERYILLVACVIHGKVGPPKYLSPASKVAMRK